MCGLGFPPVTYSQNASECLNRYIKENARGSEDVTRSLVDAVNNISSVVKRKFDEQFLAVIGKGMYRLTKRFQHLQVNESAYYRMSPHQKENMKKRVFSTSMSDGRQDRESREKSVSLSIEAEQTGLLLLVYYLIINNNITNYMYMKFNK